MDDRSFRLGDHGRYHAQKYLMTREDHIWRPNVIPEETWNAKSAGEQADWWRDKLKSNLATKGSMLEVPRLYVDGMITLSECFTLICKRATESESSEFVEKCPAEILASLRDELVHHKENDRAGWPRAIHMASYTPWTSEDENETSLVAEQQQIWDGVAILKRHVKNA